MIVAPARETPGIIARIWQHPTPSAVRSGIASTVADPRQRPYPLDQQDQKAADDKADRHDPGREQHLLDEVVQKHARDRGRQKRDDDVRDEALRRRVAQQPGDGASSSRSR